jgi:hypothetical protein
MAKHAMMRGRFGVEQTRSVWWLRSDGADFERAAEAEADDVVAATDRDNAAAPRMATAVRVALLMKLLEG